MSQFQNEDIESQTNDSIAIQSCSKQEEKGMNRQSNKVLNFFRSFREWIKRNSSKIYLLLNLVCIVFIQFSYSYYEREFICHDSSQSQCITLLVGKQKNIKKYFAIALIDCLILAFQIYLLIFNKTYRIVPFIGIIQQAWLFYIGQFQMNVFNLVGLAKAGHVALAFFFLLLIILAICFRFLWKKSKILTLAIPILILLVLYFQIYRNDCSSWKKGINGEIQAKDAICNIPIPMCSYLIFISQIDFNFVGHNCVYGETYKENFDKYFSNNIENGTIVGFSSLKNTTQLQMSHQGIPLSVFKYAKRYKTMEDALKTKQHQIMFDTVDQKYYIQVVSNETLIKEKDDLWAKAITSPSPPLVKNFLLIFLDSVSRYEVHLKLPKFASWFQTQSIQKSYVKDSTKSEKINKQRRQAYEFYRYHSIGSHTVENLYPMYYNNVRDDQRQVLKSNPQRPRTQSVHQRYKQRGFITSFASSFCASYGADIYSYEIPIFKIPVADHQAFAFNCDPNFHQIGNQFNFLKGNSASTDRCLYNKQISDYAFQYTSSFFDKYKNSSKFAQINLIEGHDFVGGSVRYIDTAITEFLQGLQKKGHLQDTLVLALSDHGQHLKYPFVESVQSDHYNPFMLMSVPQKMNGKYRDSIRLNQQNLVTAYNVYHFLNHIALGEDYEDKGKGLIGDLSFQENCTSAKIEICHCK